MLKSIEPVRSPDLSAAAAQSSAKLRHAAIIAAVLVVLGALAGLLPRWRQREVLRAETSTLAIPAVSVVSPAAGNAAPSLLLPAEVKPWLEAPIYSRSSGYLKRYLVDIGSEVQAGDLLAETDAPELRQELARTRAELAQAEAGLALAKTTADRWMDLVKTASVSEQEAAEKQADLALKSATVEASRAAVRRLEELQSFSQVKAPFAGIITARNTDVGQLVMPGAGKELFRLAQTTTLRVYVRVPQTAARGIVSGQTAELTVPEFPGRVFPAKIVRTSGALSAESRTLLTEMEVDNARREILAGSYAQVRFLEIKAASAMTLPSNTLLFRAEGPQVGVVNEQGLVQLRGVTLGRDFGPSIEILDGVAPSERVILNPPDSLASGLKVQVTEPLHGTTKPK